MDPHLTRILGRLSQTLLGLWLAGCGMTAKSTGSSGSKQPGADATLPNAHVTDASANALARKPAVAAPPMPTGEGLVSAQFFVHAVALGTELCNGNVTLKVNMALGKALSTQLFEIPEGLLQCSVLGSIDLHKLLSGVALAPGSGTVTSVANNAINIVSANGLTFTPPRPMLPSFMSSAQSALANLDITQPVSVSSAAVNDSGTVSLKMLSYNQPFAAPKLGQTFPRVIDVLTTMTGFTKIDRMANTIFDTMEIRLSTDPIAVVSLAMTATLSDLSAGLVANKDAATGLIAGAAPLAVSSQPIFGFIPNFIAPLIGGTKMEITMDLVSQEGLDLKAIAGSSNGEKIGGVATGR